MSSNTISVLNGVQRTHEVRANDRVSTAKELDTAKPAEDGKRLPLPEEVAGAKQQRLQDAVGELNSFVQNIRRNLEFTIDDESGRIVIKVIDSESKEVIRQIPPEEAVQLARTLEHAKDGTILNAKA